MEKQSSLLQLFAVAAPGLEAFTAQELRQLGCLATGPAGGILGAGEEGGGVEFTGGLETIYRANLWLRTASRVLVRLGEFYAAAFAELRKKASRLAWERYLKPGQPVAVRVTCHKSRLYHDVAVAERIAGAIGDRLGKPVPLLKFDDKAEGNLSQQGSLPQLIVVRLVHDHCTISVDSSGALLHRRGYRLATAKAPLRETLAAGMLLASGWQTVSPLLDPFCGSGTIAIEAALMARGLAPGRDRRFAFMDWPGFDVAGWQALLAENPQPTNAPAVIFASDRDAGAIQMAQANAGRAGVAECIQFSCRAVSDAVYFTASEPAGGGWVVTNPPYGLRVSANKDLRNLYAQFGKVLRAKCTGWQVTVLCNDLQLLHQMGLRLDTSLSLINGGVPVKLARGSV